MLIRAFWDLSYSSGFVGQQEQQKWVWWCSICRESIFHSWYAHCACVCWWQLPDPATTPLRCSAWSARHHTNPGELEHPHLPLTNKHLLYKGNSSHQAYGFITLLNTRNTACEVSRKILGSRNPEQLMFSLPFPPELNVDDNFHTAKESVMVRPVLWQWYFDHSPTKLGVSLISPARKYYMWGHTVSKIFSSYTLSAQPTPGAALPVVLLECFGLLLRRRLRRGTGKMLDRSQRHRVAGKVSRRSSNGQCHWSVGCIA